MAIVHDASSLGVAQGPLQDNGFGNLVAAGSVSSSFSPPANSWIYVSTAVDDLSSGGSLSIGVSNSGTALTWTQVLAHDDTHTDVEVFRAFNANSQTNITVSITGTDGDLGGIGGNIGVFFVDVWTGANSSQTGAAATNTTTTTVTSNPSVTTTASGSQVAAIGCSIATANPTSSDTILANGTVDRCGRIYKASNSGAAGSVSINYVATGATFNNFIVYEILAPGGAQAPFMIEPGSVPERVRWQPLDTSRPTPLEEYSTVPLMGQCWT
jgi:hypothetical protein